jgi:hypothetical protein
MATREEIADAIAHGDVRDLAQPQLLGGQPVREAFSQGAGSCGRA